MEPAIQRQLYNLLLILCVQKSRLVLVPSDSPRSNGDVELPAASSLKESTLSDGTSQLIVPWPLTVEELKELLGVKVEKYRVIHLSNATKVIIHQLLEWAWPVMSCNLIISLF